MVAQENGRRVYMRIDRQLALTMMTNLLKRKLKGGETAAADPVAFYGFGPDDVACVHFWKGNEEGLWFRLKDGRVFDGEARPCDTSEALYGPPSEIQQIDL
jgi:hypothetical protein